MSQCQGRDRVRVGIRIALTQMLCSPRTWNTLYSLRSQCKTYAAQQLSLLGESSVNENEQRSELIGLSIINTLTDPPCPLIVYVQFLLLLTPIPSFQISTSPTSQGWVYLSLCFLESNPPLFYIPLWFSSCFQQSVCSLCCGKVLHVRQITQFCCGSLSYCWS